MGWINQQGQYYEGDQQFGDIEYPAPPGVRYEPDGAGGWRALPPVVPASVSMAQAQAALFRSSMLDQVQAAVDATVADGDVEAGIFWRKANTVDRASQFVARLASALGLNDQQIDELFILAASIN